MPPEASLQIVREIRDEIERKVLKLIEELTVRNGADAQAQSKEVHSARAEVESLGTN